MKFQVQIQKARIRLGHLATSLASPVTVRAASRDTRRVTSSEANSTQCCHLIRVPFDSIPSDNSWSPVVTRLVTGQSHRSVTKRW
ncbi:hypothetical protein J6590_095853 [Homalodisca vitripennis]|nr:hypothetical protein J6590_080751 [Homalodisca vitripennis]KAG8255306.1 hypothetical protein J6590_095853 [Homalodisca vitripennis]